MKLRSQYDEIIKSVSQSYMPEIDWRLFKAQIWAESAFDSEAKSYAGARGLGQIMPGTWEEWSVKLGVTNINNPSENLKVAAAYMKYLRDTWKTKGQKLINIVWLLRAIMLELEIFLLRKNWQMVQHCMEILFKN